MTSCVKNKYKETNSDGGYEDAAELHNQNSEMESQIQGGIGLHEKTVFSEMKLGENTKMNTDNALEEIKKKKERKMEMCKNQRNKPYSKIKEKATNLEGGQRDSTCRQGKSRKKENKNPKQQRKYTESCGSRKPPRNKEK